MRSYEIGLSAIRTHTKTLDTIGHNIANAATPGYHRQRVDLMTRIPEFDGIHYVGTGVEIARIERVVDVATEDAILRNDSLLGLNSVEMEVSRDLESLFTPGDNSVHAALSSFFNDLESVANSPEIDTSRGEMFASAQDLLDQFANIHTGLLEQSYSRLAEARDAVEEINAAVTDIAELNAEIKIALARQRDPNSLLDRRDQILNRVSELTDVTVHHQTDGNDLVMIGGILVIADTPKRLELEQVDGRWELQFADTGWPVPLNAGRVGGLLNAVNETIPNAISRLEEAAGTIVRTVDEQHARGLKEDGAFQTLHGSREVDNINVPLVHSGIAFPMNRGQVTLSVTDPATGYRTSHRINVDPYSDSLADIASRFDAVDGVSAFVNADTGRLTISGAAGRNIDVAGRVDNVPDLTSFAGTSVPEFSGRFTGPANDQWSVAFNTAGTIGVTDGLQATVTNSNGQVVGTINLGPGYEAGTPVLLADGVSLSLGAGTVNATDTASVLMTENSDSTGLLSALGINSLFSGRDLNSFEVRRDLIESPDLLALSSHGQSGDASNIAAMTALRDIRFDELGDRTFIEELADFTADVGLESAQAASDRDQLESHANRLQQRRESMSGVSTEEEFLRMLEVERAFQAAARFITTFDSTINEIMRIVE